jgi:4-diphosphocytidyl-2-C-methyl-D-erythritol kinase
MASTLINCTAPAKLNLFLHVTGQRADGYHELQTVFQLLDHGDVLHFSLRTDREIRRIGPVARVAEADDLSVRAATLLKAHAGAAGRALGADITLIKHLPLGGGLGGGSSDAATTLLALNHLWRTDLPRTELMALGLKLGADVPFFVFGRNAFAEGVGETLVAVETPERWYVVLEPGVEAPTGRIFSDPHLTRNTKAVRISDFSKAPNGFGKNDLEAVATRLFPPIGEALNWLRQFGAARMTGSGACVFCAFAYEQEADEVLQALHKTGKLQWKAWKARGIRQHPLLNLLQT